MNNPALVSVITPCYNASSTISHTIDSVLKQTYDNWEMLIIDDCSTDESADIIKKYCKEDARIKYFRTENSTGSPSIPRNIGIDNAKGQYVAFLDADDLWLPEKLDMQIKFITVNNYDIVYSFYEKVDYKGERNGRIIRTRKKTTYDNILNTNSIPCLTSMLRRDIIGETQFRQIPQEDFCFWLDILKKGYQAHNQCDVTALYRETASSRSANKLDMFKGYWNVIHNHHDIPFLSSCFHMLVYAFNGLAKYLK